MLEAIVAGQQVTQPVAEELERRAHEWPTCACGQLCKRLPRSEKGVPLDDITYELGVSFYPRCSRRRMGIRVGYIQAN